MTDRRRRMSRVEMNSERPTPVFKYIVCCNISPICHHLSDLSCLSLSWSHVISKWPLGTSLVKGHEGSWKAEACFIFVVHCKLFACLSIYARYCLKIFVWFPFPIIRKFNMARDLRFWDFGRKWGWRWKDTFLLPTWGHILAPIRIVLNHHACLSVVLFDPCGLWKCQKRKKGIKSHKGFMLLSCGRPTADVWLMLDLPVTSRT